jgi:antitoxin component YwqK of YwqJK toxin-antitoxin module
MRAFLFYILLVFASNIWSQTNDIYEKIKNLKTVDLSKEKNNLQKVKNINKKKYYVFSYMFEKEFGDVTFPDSLSDGCWIAFFKVDTNKVALTIKYKNNSPNREVFIYNFNGNLRQKYFLNDNKIDGVCKLYHANGKIYAKLKYKQGQIIDGTLKTWTVEGKRVKFLRSAD